MRQNLRMMFHTVMASSISFLPQEQCTLQCCWLVGILINLWKSIFSCLVTSLLIYIFVNKLNTLLLSWFLNKLLPFCRFTIDVGWASTWVRIVNEWIAVCVYCEYKILHLSFGCHVEIVVSERKFLFCSMDADCSNHMEEQTNGGICIS